MSSFFLAVAFLFLILFPGTAFDGAKSGLLLWFEIVLPTLFPFLVITSVMERLLPIRSGKVYCMFTGLLSGYPIGAKSLAYSLSEKKITKKEGQFLLAFCNNASPAFLLNYVFINGLNLADKRFLLLGLIYLTGIIGAMILYPKKDIQAFDPCQTPTSFKNRLSFDETIMASFEIITKIGGYIILFSLLANIIKVHVPLPEVLSVLCCGILEITSGIRILSQSSLPAAIKLLLGMFIASFGGLSAMFQTGSVLKNSPLSMKTYIFSKLLHGIICTLLSFVLIGWIL